MRILQQCFRVYAEEIEAAVAFYEGLQGVACERRVKIPETSVEAAKVGGFLILAGDKAHLDPIRHRSSQADEDNIGWCSSKLLLDLTSFVPMMLNARSPNLRNWRQEQLWKAPASV